MEYHTNVRTFWWYILPLSFLPTPHVFSHDLFPNRFGSTSS